MPKVRLENGVNIHYQRVGQGPDMVMIHGFTGNLAVWHLQIAPLLWDHYRMLSYDLRGHGHSDTPPAGYTADDMAEDLYQLLNALEIEQAILVGHSFGADIALYFAYHHPERVKEVVAIEAALPALNDLRSHGDWEGWSYWISVLEEAGFSVPPERRTDLNYLVRTSLSLPKKWGPLKGLPRDPERSLRLLDETTVGTDYSLIGSLTLDRISEIQPPVHLIYNDYSAFMDTYDYLREHLPSVQATLFPQSEWGHFGLLDQPDLVADYLLNLLIPRQSQ
jgi:pimeloyl-ACP methyl ester carboxylesterase